MSAWSVLFAKKYKGIWKKGTKKANLSITEQKSAVDLIVQIEGRTLEHLNLKTSTVTYSLFGSQIRFLVYEQVEARQFALDFDSAGEAIQCKSLLEKYSAVPQRSLDRQGSASQHSLESQDVSMTDDQSLATPTSATLVNNSTLVTKKEDKQEQRQELVNSIKKLISDINFKDFVKLVEEIVANEPEIAGSDLFT